MRSSGSSAKLIIRSHGGSEYEIPLSRERLSIGRSRDADLMLDDEFASRAHAVVESRGGRYFICDEGSTNGTLVQGEPVRGERQLRNGEEIRIGETTLLFREEVTGQSTTRALHPPSPEQLDSAVQVDTQAWEVWVDGRRLEKKLSVLEFKLLAHLYRRANAVCSRDEIGAELWGDGAYTFEMLHQLVHRLKRRLEPDPAAPRFIISVPGVGYRLANGRSGEP